MGHILSKNGIKIDEDRVEAIKQIEPPNNVKELRTFMRIINYSAKFLPKISEQTKNMRKLEKKDVLWHWSREQQEEFDNVKDLISNAPILAFYDPKCDIYLQCDASSYGLGAALIQNDKPISFASRSLTETE